MSSSHPPTPPAAPARRGLALFNAGRFFEAHEALEDAWRETNDETKRWMQGLVQVAVAMHHYSTGNLAGATSVLRRAARNLEHCPPHLAGIDIDGLRRSLAEWNDALAAGRPVPAPPRMRLLGDEHETAS